VRVANEVANEDGYGPGRSAVHAAPSPGSHAQTPAGHVRTVSCAPGMRRSIGAASAPLARVFPHVTAPRNSLTADDFGRATPRLARQLSKPHMVAQGFFFCVRRECLQHSGRAAWSGGPAPSSRQFPWCFALWSPRRGGISGWGRDPPLARRVDRFVCAGPSRPLIGRG